MTSRKIEITPEMVEAGSFAVSRCLGPGRLYAPMTEEQMAIEVFQAMSRAAIDSQRAHDIKTWLFKDST